MGKFRIGELVCYDNEVFQVMKYTSEYGLEARNLTRFVSSNEDEFQKVDNTFTNINLLTLDGDILCVTTLSSLCAYQVGSVLSLSILTHDWNDVNEPYCIIRKIDGNNYYAQCYWTDEELRYYLRNRHMHHELSYELIRSYH